MLYNTIFDLSPVKNNNKRINNQDSNTTFTNSYDISNKYVFSSAYLFIASATIMQ